MPSSYQIATIAAAFIRRMLFANSPEKLRRQKCRSRTQPPVLEIVKTNLAQSCGVPISVHFQRCARLSVLRSAV